MRRPGSLSMAAAVLALLPLAAHAEPLPKPAVDYVVEGTMTSGKGSNPATMRHGAGKMRFDTEADGHAASVYIDIAARTAIVVTQRLGQKIAMQVDPERAGEAANFLDRDARVVGEAKVAGEACTEYEFETAKGRSMRTCVTRDGIPLRNRDLTRDRVAWVASKVTRAPQAAAQFVVPSDAIPVQIPKMR